MYDYTGIIVLTITFTCSLILGITVVLLSRRVNTQKRKIPMMFVSIAIIIGAVFMLSQLIPALISPDIEMLEGIYADTHNPTSGAHLTRTIYFDIGERDDTSLMLDVFSMHKILPVMEEGQLYRVWYEANTEIIVKCEPI